MRESFANFPILPKNGNIMEKEKIERAAINYVERHYPNYHPFKKHDINLFTQGALWRINAVWHEASEYPNPHTPILVERDGGLYSVNMVANVRQRKLPTSWKRWAYLADLLPDTRKEAEP